MSTATHQEQQLPAITFGDRLRRYRISTMGMTLRQFAVGTNLSQSTLSRIEHDGGDPADEHIQRAAKLLQLRYKVSADWLLYGDDLPRQRNSGAQLPRLDSNQEPTGYPIRPVTSLLDRLRSRSDGASDFRLVVRLLPLPDDLARRLEQRPAGWVFPSPYGGHLKPDTVGKKLSTALGDGWSAHTLRHRFASLGYAGTRDLRSVQEALGHSSPTTTARYVALPSDGLRSVVDAAATGRLRAA